MSVPTRPVVRSRWIDTAVAGLAGLVAASAYPPFDLGPMIIVGLAPLLWMWRRSSPGHAALLGFVWGVPFFTAVMYWIVYFGAVAIVPLISALAGTIALVGAAVGLLGRFGVRSAWVTAAVWTLVELITGRFPLGGLPWADTSVAMVDVGPVVALARWGGATLVTFLVLLATGLAVGLVDEARSGAFDRLRALGAGGALVAVAAAVLVASLTASTGPEAGELHFAMIQGNDINRDLTDEEHRQRYLPTSHFELADTLRGDYDLIVFPESSMDRDPRGDPFLGDQLARVARTHDSFVLTNAGAFEPDGRSFNMNFMYGPDGELLGTYAKQRLVPFGEYVPWEGVLSRTPVLASAIEQVPNRYSSGNETVVFDVRGIPVATIICFENSFTGITRDAVRDGAQVLVVSTNNRSYRRSSNPAQHVNLSRMRAVETGRPVLHASISGITAVVDADGRVLDRSELFVNSVAQGTITARTGQTPYVRYGNWPAALCIVTVAAAGLVASSRRRAAMRTERPVDSAPT